MKKVVLFFFCAAAFMFLSGCLGDSVSSVDDKPYYASPARRDQIVSGVSKLTRGMDEARVKSLMGEPDETLKLYKNLNDMKSGKNPTGYAFIYLIQRKKKFGSMLERNEKLVRVEFGPGGNVLKILKIGISGR